MKKLFFLLTLTFYLSPFACFAAFEQIGAGARPLGMASAFTAVSDDAHAIYYNPAGLAQARRGELTAGYGKLYIGLKDNSNLGTGFVGAVQPIRGAKWGTIGVGWVSLNLEGAYREDSVALGYGRELFAEGLFFGGTGKLLKRTFGSDDYTKIDPLFARNGYNTTNFSGDMGMLYRPVPQYSFALAVKDFNEPNVGLGSQDKVPMEIRGGFAYHQRTLVFDSEISKKDKDVQALIGIEKWLFGSVGLRAGLAAGSKNKREIGTGLGYRSNFFSLDYAFIFPLAGVESTAGSHRFGFTVRFGARPEKARWEFEEEEHLVERILEEKTAQINEIEKEIDSLRDQSQSGRLESSWARKQIQKLEDKLKTQQSEDLKSMKQKMFESKVETDRMKQKIQELEQKIQKLSTPRPPARGPRKPEPEKVQEPAPVVPRTYVVKEGETLDTIAVKFYGNSQRWVDIYEANSDRVERGGTLTPGQVLILPQP